jgi:hypothetical protein
VTRADRVATLDDAKAQFQKGWDAWKAWAKLEEEPYNQEIQNTGNMLGIGVFQPSRMLAPASAGAFL